MTSTNIPLPPPSVPSHIGNGSFLNGPPSAAPAATVPLSAPAAGAPEPAAFVPPGQPGGSFASPTVQPSAGVALPVTGLARIPSDVMPTVQTMLAETEANVRAQTRREVEMSKQRIAELTSENANLRATHSTLEARVRNLESQGLTPDQRTQQELARLQSELATAQATIQATTRQHTAMLEELRLQQGLAELARYRAQLLAQYASHVEPELHDTVGGNSVEELHRSLTNAMQRTTEIRNRYASRSVAPLPPSAPSGLHVISPVTAQSMSLGLRQTASPTVAPAAFAPPPIPAPPTGVPMPGDPTKAGDDAAAAAVRDARTFEGMQSGKYAGMRESLLSRLPR